MDVRYKNIRTSGYTARENVIALNKCLRDMNAHDGVDPLEDELCPRCRSLHLDDEPCAMATAKESSQ